MPIALALIVKNEAPTIAQTLESARVALGPGPTVVHDTGSTDGTADAIEVWATGANSGRGTVYIHPRPFGDFSSARNACLADAFEHAPIVAMVDAGVLVRGTFDPSAHVDGCAWDVLVRLGMSAFPRPQVFTRGWKYVGKVHEYAEGPGPRLPCALEFAYVLKDEERPKRWLRDLALLEGDFTPRGRFYYAQTLQLVGRRTQAIAACLERAAITNAGFWQERAVAYARCAEMAPTLKEAEGYVELALRVDPSRGDFYLTLCERYEQEQMWSHAYAAATKALLLVPRADALFARTDRAARANVYAGDAASSQGKYALARMHWLRALEVGGLDADTEAEVRAAVEAGS